MWFSAHKNLAFTATKIMRCKTQLINAKEIVMIKKLIIAAIVAASLGSIEVSASAREVIIRVAPPELRIESVPAARHGYQWAPDYWNWSGRRHVWVKGAWMRDRPGYLYNQPVWEQRDGNWTYKEEIGRVKTEMAMAYPIDSIAVQIIPTVIKWTSV